MANTIGLTHDLCKNIDYNKIIAFSVAESGAMGCPGEVKYVVYEDGSLNIFGFNYCFSDKDLVNEAFSIIPWLKDVKLGLGRADNFHIDWVWNNLGYGNHLFLRKGDIFEYYRIRVKAIITVDQYPIWESIIEDFYNKRWYGIKRRGDDLEKWNENKTRILTEASKLAIKAKEHCKQGMMDIFVYGNGKEVNQLLRNIRDREYDIWRISSTTMDSINRKDDPSK